MHSPLSQRNMEHCSETWSIRCQLLYCAVTKLAVSVFGWWDLAYIIHPSHLQMQTSVTFRHPSHLGMQFKNPVYTTVRLSSLVLATLLFHTVLKGPAECGQYLAWPKNKGTELDKLKQKDSLEKQNPMPSRVQSTPCNTKEAKASR